MNYISFPTAQHAVEKIAQEFVIYSQLNHPVHISLSGGSTPKLLFKTLAKLPYAEQINWKNLHFWWGADILKEIQTTPAENLPYPAAKIKAKNGVTEWYLDKIAAQLL